MKEILDLLKEINDLNGEFCYNTYLQMENLDDEIMLTITSDNEEIFEYSSKSIEDVLKNTKDGLREIVKYKNCKKQLISLIEEYGDGYLSAVMDEIDWGL